MTNYMRNNKPLVIRNALATFDVGTSYRDWSLDYLSKRCGANKVHVRRNTMANAYKVGQAYFAEETTFQSYVDDLLAENELSKNSYLAVQNLRKAFPQVFEELKVAPFVQKLHGGPFLWIARAGRLSFYSNIVIYSSVCPGILYYHSFWEPPTLYGSQSS